MESGGKSRRAVSRDQWAAQIAALDQPSKEASVPRLPVTVNRIMGAAFTLVEREGYDALTMRRIAAALGVTPGALYAHVRDKAALDDLLIGELSSRVSLPVPDSSQWLSQALTVCTQLRDQYLRFPGISRAALATAPHNLDSLRLYEGLLAIFISAGIAPRTAAWAIDAAFLYIAAYSVVSLRRDVHESEDGQVDEQREAIERFEMLPEDRFPNIVRNVAEVVSGEGDDRFDFTLRTLFGGLSSA